MISKRSRQGRIVDIIRRTPVASQERLSDLLKAQGVEVTQSTLSRDVRELGLVKIRGIYHHAPGASAPAPPDNVKRSLQQTVVRADASGNIVVIKTGPGNGHALGVVLDSAQWPEVVGTIAGDDTLFVLVRSPRMCKRVLKRIEECLS
jgi:transcriptional regulator of arginine metabolism